MEEGRNVLFFVSYFMVSDYDIGNKKQRNMIANQPNLFITISKKHLLQFYLLFKFAIVKFEMNAFDSISLKVDLVFRNIKERDSF